MEQRHSLHLNKPNLTGSVLLLCKKRSHPHRAVSGVLVCLLIPPMEKDVWAKPALVIQPGALLYRMAWLTKTMLPGI